MTNPRTDYARLSAEARAQAERWSAEPNGSRLAALRERDAGFLAGMAADEKSNQRRRA